MDMRIGDLFWWSIEAKKLHNKLNKPPDDE